MLLRRAVITLATVLTGGLVSEAEAQNLGTVTTTVYTKMVGEAVPQILNATALLMEARGLKQQADSLRANAQSISSGGARPDKAVFERSMKQVSEATVSVVSGLTGSASAMSAEQTKTFIEGVVAFFKGVKSTREVSMQLPELTSAISATASGGPMALARERNNLLVARAIVSGLPDLVKGNIEAATALKNYVTANRIQVDLSALEP